MVTQIANFFNHKFIRHVHHGGGARMLQAQDESGQRLAGRDPPCSHLPQGYQARPHMERVNLYLSSLT